MKKHYIDNKEFERILLSYQKDPKTYEEELISLFDLLITNIIESFKFKVDHDDAKQECFALIFKTVNKFTPRKGTAFNYFTTIIINNLKFIYSKEKKYQQKIENYITKVKKDLT